MKKPKVGRPKLPKGEVKHVVAIRLSNEERKDYARKAEQKGVPLSEWIREMLRHGWFFVLRCFH